MWSDLCLVVWCLGMFVVRLGEVLGKIFVRFYFVDWFVDCVDCDVFDYFGCWFGVVNDY